MFTLHVQKHLTTCMSLIHIHVSTCVDVPISLDHVTTQTNITSIVFSALVNLETTILLPTHGYIFFYIFKNLHDNDKYDYLYFDRYTYYSCHQ